MTAAPLPVSTWLEQEVLSYTYRSGLTLWLDRDGHYNELRVCAARSRRGSSVERTRVVGTRVALTSLYGNFTLWLRPRHGDEAPLQAT